MRRAVIQTLRDRATAATLVSASATKVVYKGLLSSAELGEYFADLRDPAFVFALRRVPPALQHEHLAADGAWCSRSTTSRTTARSTRSPATAPGCARAACPPRWASDSLNFNTALDAMLGAGYRIDEAVDMMLSPSVDAATTACARTTTRTSRPSSRGTVRRRSSSPTAIRVGAALDRSGFRPLRWCRTASGKVLAASETGVVDFGDDAIVQRGRLGPGDRLVVRFASGQLVRPGRVPRRAPRARRLPRDRRSRGGSRCPTPSRPAVDADALRARSGALRLHQRRTQRRRRVLAGGRRRAGALDGRRRGASRSSSAACRSRRTCARTSRKSRTRRSTRCAKASSSTCARGSARATTNGDVPAPGAIVMLETAVLDESAFDELRFDARLVQHRVALELGDATLRARIARICDEAERAVRDGATYLVLDDRGVTLPVPAILAAGAIHQRLTRAGLRMQASIAVCDGFARDAHASRRSSPSAPTSSRRGSRRAPRRADRHAQRVPRHGALRPDQDHGEARHLLAALVHRRADVRVARARAAKSSTRVSPACTRTSRRSASRSSKKICAPGARSREGRGPPIAACSASVATACATPSIRALLKTLRAGDRRGDEAAFLELSDRLEAREPINLRDLVEPVPLGEPIPLDEVEPEEAILARFATAAMSLGALAPEVHKTIARGANRLGARSNSGEGGEDPAQVAATRSSRSPRAASASARPTSPAPTRSRSRWRRARSPAKAARFRASR